MVIHSVKKYRMINATTTSGKSQKTMLCQGFLLQSDTIKCDLSKLVMMICKKKAIETKLIPMTVSILVAISAAKRCGFESKYVPDNSSIDFRDIKIVPIETHSPPRNPKMADNSENSFARDITDAFCCETITA